MWYQTVTEARQTVPPEEKRAEQQSDSLTDPTVPADAEKTKTTPGSEYWLP
jgi:hypothetical protein